MVESAPDGRLVMRSTQARHLDALRVPFTANDRKVALRPDLSTSTFDWPAGPCDRISTDTKKAERQAPGKFRRPGGNSRRVICGRKCALLKKQVFSCISSRAHKLIRLAEEKKTPCMSKVAVASRSKVCGCAQSLAGVTQSPLFCHSFRRHLPQSPSRSKPLSNTQVGQPRISPPRASCSSIVPASLSVSFSTLPCTASESSLQPGTQGNQPVFTSEALLSAHSID